jgi:predicted HicB family RNase H-like nuclease
MSVHDDDGALGDSSESQDGIHETVDNFLMEMNEMRLKSPIDSPQKKTRRKRKSVTFSLRMSEQLHAFIEEEAWKHRTNRNDLVVSALIEKYKLDEEKYR